MLLPILTFSAYIILQCYVITCCHSRITIAISTIRCYIEILIRNYTLLTSVYISCPLHSLLCQVHNDR